MNSKAVKCTEDDLINGLIQGTLPPSAFDHEAHLRMAWILLERYDVSRAMEKASSIIKSYVTHVGATDKYNETLTQAAVRVVNHFKQKNTSPSFDAFVEEFPRLKFNFKELILQHYTSDVFTNPQARVEYQDPDLLDFS